MRFSPPPAAPEAFLKWSMDIHSGLRSFQCSGTWAIRISDRVASRLTRREIAFVAPNKFRVISENGPLIHHYACDGERFLIWPEGYPIPASYSGVPQSFSEMGFAGGLMSHPHFGGSCLYTFFGGSSLASTLTKNAAWQKKPDVPLKYGPEETLDGAVCRTLILSGGVFSDERRLSISTTDGLVRRILGITHARNLTPEERRLNAQSAETFRNSETFQKLPAKMKHGALDGFNRTKMPKSIVEENYTGFVLNASIPDATFDTRLPAGASLEVAGLRGASPTPKEGSLAPNFTASRLADKKPVSLTSLRGKVVLLDFWATWCGPCVRALPGTLRFQKELASKSLEVVAISDEPAATVTKFLKTRPELNGLNVALSKDAGAKFGVSSIPTLVVIDKAGKVVAQFVGEQERETLRKALVKAGL